MKKFVLVLLMGVSIGVSALCAQADQLQWNLREDAERAAKAIKPGSVVVSYCSQCDAQTIEVWWAERAVVTTTPENELFEVQVFGKRLMASEEKFDKGKFTGPATLTSKNISDKNRWFLEAVDLAYVYVPVGNGRFRVLGKELGLAADVRTEFVALPANVLAKIEAENKNSSNDDNPYTK
jgi:hypothetical protein